MLDSHENRSHAILSPSSSYRWIPCPGSKDGNLIPSENTKASLDGTAAHEQAEQILKTGHGLDDPNIPDSVRHYVRTVLERSEGATLVLHEVMLQSKEFPDLHFGTLDTGIWFEDELELIVIDLKSGRGRVYAEDNTQLMCYINLLRDDPRFKKAKHFTGIIVQDTGPDIATYTTRQLNALKKQVAISANTNERNAGGHCEYCPLIATCATAKTYITETATKVFDEYGDDFTPEVVADVMSVEDAKLFIEWERVAKKIAKLSKQHLRNMMLKGQKVSGWKLGVGLKNREWIDEIATVVELSARGLTNEQIYKTSLLTPAQIEGILGKKAGIDSLTKRDTKGVAAVPQRSKLREFIPGEFVVSEFDDFGEDDG